MQTVKGKYTFYVGLTFNSYDELQERMSSHSQENFVYYWRRDTRTVQGAFMKTSRPIAQHLKYYSVRYACVYGGQKFRSRGQGRRQTQTLRNDCPSFIMLRASKCGQKLEVIAVCNDHNHEISELASKCLPQKRKLPESIKEEVLQMLAQHIDKRKIIDYVFTKTRKLLTQKDLHNLRAASKQILQDLSTIQRDSEIVENVEEFVETDSKDVEWEQSTHTIYPKKMFVLDQKELLVKQENVENGASNEAYETQSYDEQKIDDQEFNYIEHTNTTSIHSETIPDQCLPDSLLSNAEEVDCMTQDTTDEIVGYISNDDSYCIIEESLEEPFVETTPNASYVEVRESNEGMEMIENSMQTDHLNENTRNDLSTGTQDLSDGNAHQIQLDEESPGRNVSIMSKHKRSAILYKYFTKNVTKRSRRLKMKSDHCRQCGGHSKLINMQIEVLKAQKQKLMEETHILRLTKVKLISELSRLHNGIALDS